MVRTIVTTTMNLTIKEKDAENERLITRDFIGSNWTPFKMMNKIKKSATFPADAEIVNMTTESKMQTYTLSDAAFVRAALNEMQSGSLDDSDQYADEVSETEPHSGNEY